MKNLQRKIHFRTDPAATDGDAKALGLETSKSQTCSLFFLYHSQLSQLAGKPALIISDFKPVWRLLSYI